VAGSLGLERSPHLGWNSDQGGVWLLGLLLVAPAGLVVGLRTVPQLDLVFQSVNFHLIVVSAIAAAALGIAVLAVMAAARSGHPALVLVALGCLAVGFFMLAHGLTTPGIAGRPVNTWIGRFPVLAIFAFAACLSGALVREDHRLVRPIVRRPRAVLTFAALSLALLATVVSVRPTAAAGSGPLAYELGGRQILLALSVVALVVVGAVHWRRWRLGHDRVELALVLAAWFSAHAAVSLQFGELWHLSWWDYHAYLLAGFAAGAYGVVTGYLRTRSAEGTLASIRLREPIEHLTHGSPEVLHVLVAAVEAKDRYTHGHSTRVADLSVRMGLRLGLRPAALRGLTQGALLHDVGKIGVPDHILNKPGQLTPEERAWIEEHPVVGWEIGRRAPSLRDALVVVRHHHERVDGTGYPDGLASEAIPFAARIVAVADVWDALTSDRAYRPAWDPPTALAHILAGRGHHFDPVCVSVCLALMAEEGVRPVGERGDDVEAAAAAQACHGHAHHAGHREHSR
jgi:HD-GYP domain-containing protein (c-di-GMP phosphodiesterase class II)